MDPRPNYLAVQTRCLIIAKCLLTDCILPSSGSRVVVMWGWRGFVTAALELDAELATTCAKYSAWNLIKRLSGHESVWCTFCTTFSVDMRSTHCNNHVVCCEFINYVSQLVSVSRTEQTMTVIPTTDSNEWSTYFER